MAADFNLPRRIDRAQKAGALGFPGKQIVLGDIVAVRGDRPGQARYLRGNHPHGRRRGGEMNMDMRETLSPQPPPQP